MAEYKNGVTPFGNVSVTKETMAPEVKTGRAVFVNEELYANDEGYKAKVDKCIYEGFHRVSEDGSGSGSGSCDCKGKVFEVIEKHSSGSGWYGKYNLTYQDVLDSINRGIPLIYKVDMSESPSNFTKYCTVVDVQISDTPDLFSDYKYFVRACVCTANFDAETLDNTYEYLRMSAINIDDYLEFTETLQ